MLEKTEGTIKNG